jgi:hypothetical protein
MHQVDDRLYRIHEFVQLRLIDSSDNPGMIVTHVVNTVAGIEIQNPPPIIGEEFGTEATRVTDIHPEHVEQAHSLRIDVLFVQRLLLG